MSASANPLENLLVISHSGLHEPWREMLHLGTHMVLSRSQYTYTASPECFYFIDKGRVRLTYTNALGQEHVVMFFGKDCIFNETHVLVRGSDAGLASFRVLERTEVYRFSGSLLHDRAFIAEHPHLYENMLTATAIKFSNMFMITYLIKHGTPMARVCRFLRQMHYSHNAAARFPLDMTQIELASVLDIHRVSLFRCLQQLKEMGIILAFSRHEVQLGNIEALEALLDQQEKTDWG